MTELHPSSQTMKPQNGVHQSMCLQLQTNKDCLKTSSSSSSPDSTYSLSSLDVDMPEGMMGRKKAISENDSGIQSPDCRPDDNDNSVSVYLDAKEEGWHAKCDDRDNVTIIHNQHLESDNVFSDAGVCGEQERRGSGDSLANDAQLFSSGHDESEYEEEESFLSLRSADVVIRNHSEPEEDQMCSSNKRPSVGPVNELHQKVFETSVVLSSEKDKTSSSTMRHSVSLGSDLHHKAHQESVDLHKNEEQMTFSTRSLDVGSVSQELLQGSLGLTDDENQIQTSAKRPNLDLVKEIYQEAVQTTNDLSHSFSQGALPSISIQNFRNHPYFPKRNISQNINDPPGLSHTKSPMIPPKKQSTSVDIKRVSRPSLKDIKPKVISRAMSSPRPVNTNHSQSAAGGEKNSLTTRSRATNRRERGNDGVKNNPVTSYQPGVATPTTTSDSDSKSICPLMVTEQPPEFIESKTVNNGGNVQIRSSKVTESGHKEEAVVQETSRDGNVDQTVSSDLRPPGRVPSRGCVSAGVRAPTLSGVPKMRVIDSSPAISGSSPSWKAPPKPASSKLPIKCGSLPMSLSSSSVGSTANENKGAAQVMKSEECVRPVLSSQGKSINSKPAAGVRTRANTPSKPNTAGQKATAQVLQSKTTHSALQRGGAVRPNRNSATVCPSSRGPRGTRPVHIHSEEEEKKNRSILHLRSLVAHGNRRLEAFALVIQHIFNEKEEALKQKKELSIQLKNLREELAQSVVCCERLECEKASVCAQLDSAVLTLQQQHQAELTQLEDRLRDFYSAEWDKVHQVYQDEADRCSALMRQQVEEVKSKQEAMRTEQEVVHSRKIEELRQGYEMMIAELQKNHERDRQELDNTLKSSEAVLNERIVNLMQENETLGERLSETEERRKALADNSQRDCRVVYLEQELESLKVVLDIKNSQLHQQDKKLMQMDKLMESNVKLEEFVTKLQQENEDYKARMDKHAELSRQLSTEQAMLQQTLQKESKANKRLSMENEELLWKLHNGLSPRNSASFPSSPVSPR